jgi:hypothetical protein
LDRVLLSDDALFIAVHDLAKSGQRGPILLLLSHVEQPAQTAAVRDKGISIGFRALAQWNLSDVLKAAAKDGLVAQLKAGWKLLTPGLKSIESHYRPEAPIIAETRHALRDHIAKLGDAHRRHFLEEAVMSFDTKSYRAAIVLSWVGAAHILQEFVVTFHLAAFNSAAVARAKKQSDPRRKQFIPIRGIKDFWSVEESDMLQLCQDAGILDKAEKQELQARLDLRNRCGHPNAVVVAEHTVAAHIESLLLNVYSKY